MIAFTERAAEILRRTVKAARRLNPEAMVRMQRDPSDVGFVLTDRCAETDELVVGEGFELVVEAGLEGTVDVAEPHDRLVLRPPGDGDRDLRPKGP